MSTNPPSPQKAPVSFEQFKAARDAAISARGKYSVALKETGFTSFVKKRLPFKLLESPSISQTQGLARCLLHSDTTHLDDRLLNSFNRLLKTPLTDAMLTQLRDEFLGPTQASARNTLEPLLANADATWQQYHPLRRLEETFKPQLVAEAAAAKNANKLTSRAKAWLSATPLGKKLAAQAPQAVPTTAAEAVASSNLPVLTEQLEQTAPTSATPAAAAEPIQPAAPNSAASASAKPQKPERFKSLKEFWASIKTQMRASKKYYLADKNAAATQSRATAQHGSTVESAASHSTGKTALGIGLVGLGSWAAYELLREDKSKTQNLER